MSLHQPESAYSSNNKLVPVAYIRQVKFNMRYLERLGLPALPLSAIVPYLANSREFYYESQFVPPILHTADRSYLLILGSNAFRSVTVFPTIQVFLFVFLCDYYLNSCFGLRSQFLISLRGKALIICSI